MRSRRDRASSARLGARAMEHREPCDAMTVHGNAACTANTVHATVYTTLHTTHYALCTMHDAPHTMHHTLCTTHYTLHTTHYTLHTTHYTLHTTHYTLDTTRYTLHTTRCTLHTTHYTTHNAPCTIHDAPRTVRDAPHTTHYNLHTTPCIRCCVGACRFDEGRSRTHREYVFKQYDKTHTHNKTNNTSETTHSHKEFSPRPESLLPAARRPLPASAARPVRPPSLLRSPSPKGGSEKRDPKKGHFQVAQTKVT